MVPVLAGRAVKTDHWFYGLFQAAPDLITLLLPGETQLDISLTDSFTITWRSQRGLKV